MSDDMPIRPAATVIIIRDGAEGPESLETLLVRRSAGLAFHGGSWVFPGGRIDDADFPATPDGAPDRVADAEIAARAAAVREAKEEASLVIDPATLVPWAHWTTPPGRTRRFATWFYMAAAPAGRHEVVVDGSEISDHRWFAPAEALQARRDGEIELPAPTFVSLLRLAGCRDVASALDHARTYPYLELAPRPVAVEGGTVTIYNGDVAYDPEAGDDIERPGIRHRLYMVGQDWRYENQLRDR